MSAEKVSDSPPWLSKRQVRWAGLAAFVGCAACCALPLLALSGIGGGAASTLASFVKPGTELLVGVSVFVLSLGVLALFGRKKASAGCGPACSANGSCCNRGAIQEGE